MRSVDFADLVKVSQMLEPLGVNFTFTGGSVLGLLLDNPMLSFPRMTDDVDVIVEVITRIEYTNLEEKLRTEAKFKHDTSQGSPACRWIFNDLKVDIMPIRDTAGPFSDRWFEYALRTFAFRTFQGRKISTVSATCLAATKLTAMSDRGRDDYLSSHDLEDLITLVDGREMLYEEIAGEWVDLREYITNCVAKLLEKQAFLDALCGHLPPDSASQARLPLLLNRLHLIGSLAKL